MSGIYLEAMSRFTLSLSVSLSLKPTLSLKSTLHHNVSTYAFMPEMSIS